MANRYASILADPMARAILVDNEPPIAQDRRMYLLVDTTNRQALARHSSMRALQALHYIQFANTDGVIIPEGANRGWAQVDRDCIVGVLQNAGYRGTYPQAYNECIKLARQVMEAAEWLVMPFTLNHLEAQAQGISAREGRPARFDPNGNTAVQADAWPFAPQRLAPRCDSTFALEFSAGTAGVIPRVPLPATTSSGKVQPRSANSSKPQETGNISQAKEPTMATAKKAAAKKAAAKSTKKAVAPKPPKAPAAPKPPKAAKGKGDPTVKAPREGGTTRIVWDACEKLLAKTGKCPSFAAVNAKVGDAAPQATQRSMYTYWRKGKGFSGRIVD